MRRRDGQLTLRTGITVAYDDRGSRDGPPVLLIHAWAESVGAFDRMTALLPAEFRVLGFDQRGHGLSDKPADGYRLSSLVDDCVSFMDSVGVASAYVVGSSSGGYVAQQLAVSHPGRVSGLVLVGAPFSLESAPAFESEVSALTDPVDPAWVREFNGAMTRDANVPADYIDDRVNDGLQLPAAVWAAALRGLVDSERPTRAGPIDVPTLIIWGDDDTVLDEDQLAALRAALPRSEVNRYAGIGHLVLWEDPASIAADLSAFIRAELSR